MQADVMEFIATSPLRVLLVPGLHGSGVGHWQTRWQALYPRFEWVAQVRPDLPELEVWSQRVRRAVQSSPAPCVIVAHSFACLASLHSNADQMPNLLGMLLVAPADPQKFGISADLRNITVNIPSVVIGSTNDPWMSGQSAAWWAQQWQAQFVSAGARGHINADSELADWPFGLMQLTHLLAQCAESCIDLS